jgi:two-component system, LytTR family, response regulator
MNYLLIDDEELARKRLQTLIEECEPNLICLGEASNAMDGIKLIHKHKPDIIFLDIQMPELSGFDMLELLPQDQLMHIVFVTAYDEFALKAFEAHAIDYLLKPVKKSRLEDTLSRILSNPAHISSSEKLKEQLGLNETKNFQRIAVQHKQETILLPLDSILWIESRDTLTYVHTSDKNQYRCDRTLDDLEQRLPQFFRLHRSYLVHIQHIVKLIPWFNGAIKVELVDGTQLEVAKRRVSDLKRALSV